MDEKKKKALSFLSIREKKEEPIEYKSADLPDFPALNTVDDNHPKADSTGSEGVVSQFTQVEPLPRSNAGR